MSKVISVLLTISMVFAMAVKSSANNIDSPTVLYGFIEENEEYATRRDLLLCLSKILNASLNIDGYIESNAINADVCFSDVTDSDDMKLLKLFSGKERFSGVVVFNGKTNGGISRIAALDEQITYRDAMAICLRFLKLYDRGGYIDLRYDDAVIMRETEKRLLLTEEQTTEHQKVADGALHQFDYPTEYIIDISSEVRNWWDNFDSQVKMEELIKIIDLLLLAPLDFNCIWSSGYICILSIYFDFVEE